MKLPKSIAEFINSLIKIILGICILIPFGVVILILVVASAVYDLLYLAINIPIETISAFYRKATGKSIVIKESQQDEQGEDSPTLAQHIVEKRENKRCKISYDVFNQKIICEDKKITDEHKKKFTITKCYNMSFGELWQIITDNFNEMTQYAALRKNLSEYAYIIDETTKVKDRNIILYQNSPIKTVDVNGANENELCTLPGINKIQAKKIIQFRERERYFNSREDFFETMKIKEHFCKQMKIIVVANPVENTVKLKQKKAERIVDF